MKLAEALVLRADSQKRLEQLRNRILRNATIQEGSSPAENPEQLLAEYERVAAELIQLMNRINLTNAEAQISGRTMTEALAERDILKKKQVMYQELAQSATIRPTAVTRSEIRIRGTVNVAATQRQADTIAAALQELDTRIQQANWTIDLVE